jgi:hypothetical protein
LHVTDFAAKVTCHNAKGAVMVATINERAAKRRKALRAAGLRPVQIWVPDTRLPHFAAECQRQSELASDADLADAELMQYLDEALAEVAGWTA